MKVTHFLYANIVLLFGPASTPAQLFYNELINILYSLIAMVRAIFLDFYADDTSCNVDFRFHFNHYYRRYIVVMLCHFIGLYFKQPPM